MRRALRLLSLLTLLLAATSGVTGLVLARRIEAVHASSIPAPGALGHVHALSGHAAAVAACLGAATAFLLGLHGLLESGGRRGGALILFVLGPLLMGLGLWAGVTGMQGAVTVGTMPPDPRAASLHETAGAAFAACSLVLAAAALVLARPDRPEPED